MNARIVVFVFCIGFSLSVHAGEPFLETSKACGEHDSKACSALRSWCESGEALACYHLSYNLGLAGQDELGLTYLKKACRGGIASACRHIPIIQRYIESKHAGAVKL